MDTFWKILAAAMLTVILSLTMEKRDLAVLLVLAGCCIAAVGAMGYLEPVLDLVAEIESMIPVEQNTLRILVKAAGIGLVTEIASTVCADGGAGSLGKMLQFLGSAMILYLSIPVFQSLLALIREILVQA